MKRLLATTDRSETAERALAWAADLASRLGAELLVLQVLAPDPTAPAARVRTAVSALEQSAASIAGPGAKARVEVDEDPAAAIVRVAAEEGVDAIVVGNRGMSGRTEFLLGNVSNRVSHTAPCAVIIADTRDAADAVVVEPGPPDREARGSLLGRATHIGRVLRRSGVRQMLRPSASDDELREHARTLRGALEQLGPTFGKLGQVLSTRPDLLPQVVIEELSTLHSRVAPLTEAEVVTVMEQELRVPWEDVFEHIEPEPIAAGTMAQVHAARLMDGTEVVVKVQRPTARADIERDLALLRMFAQKMGGKPTVSAIIDLPGIVDELSRALMEELDSRIEVANSKRLSEVLAPYPRLDVPRVHEQYCTDRLIVMDAIRGVRLSEAPDGPERREAARQLLESYYRQILGEGFFHADPHPGNLLWDGDKVWFLDAGMVGEVGPEVRGILLLIILAFWQRDVAFLSELVLMLTGDDQREDIDTEGFREELGGMVDRLSGSSLQEIQLGPLLQEMTDIAVRHRVRVPASLALTGKALAQVQLVVAQMDPSLDPFSVAGAYFMKSLTGQVFSGDPKRLFYEGQKLRLRATRLVESIERLAGARPGRNLQIDFRGTERLEKVVRQTGRRLSLSIASGSALVGTAVTASADVAGWVPVSLGVTGGVLAAGLIADLLRGSR
jgi:predicted unusual protein kinase regulating ubiquinone biosynthesis (AarF/ABC1/UbiB family)/nucleotide-binding universal stress UspA family protein